MVHRVLFQSLAKLDYDHGASTGDESQRKRQSKRVGDGGWLGMGDVAGGLGQKVLESFTVRVLRRLHLPMPYPFHSSS